MKIQGRVIQVLCLFGLWLGVGLQAQAQTDTVTYVYTDPQGTPLVKADASGNVIAKYDYTPYGNSITSLGVAPNGPGYTGHVNDPETGLVYMQARYYQPTGRFPSPDPVGLAPGNIYSFNRYAYADNNPIVHDDPTGMYAGDTNGPLNQNDSNPSCNGSYNCQTFWSGGDGGGGDTANSGGWFAAAMRGIAAHKFIEADMAQALPNKEVKVEFRIYDLSSGAWFRADILIRNGPLSPWMVFEIKPASQMASGYQRSLAASQLNKYVTAMRTSDSPNDAEVGNWSSLFPGTKLRTVNIPTGIKMGGIDVGASYLYGPAPDQSQSGIIYYMIGEPSLPVPKK